MKKWTDDPTYEDMVRPLYKAAKFAYTFKRKNKGKDIPYDGLGIPSMLAGCPNINYSLSAKGMKFHEERGTSVLEVIIAKAINLGIEQGMRWQWKRLKERRPLIEELLRDSSRDHKDFLIKWLYDYPEHRNEE